MKVLTISIAAYNVEKYLAQTLDSLIDERLFQDVEVIVVDDGSKDNTRNIAMQYSKKYPNYISVIAKENGGHGSTLNAGILNAHGKYYRFLDGDDWMAADELVNVVEKMKKCETDLICCNYTTINDKSGEKINYTVKDVEYEKIYNLDEAGSLQFLATQHLFVRTEVLKNNEIRIDENCFYVDMEYALLAVIHSKSIVYFSNCVYLYRVGLATQSMSRKGLIKNYKHRIKVVNTILNHYVQEKDNCKEVAGKYVEALLAANVRNVLDGFFEFPIFRRGISREMRDFRETINQKSPAIFSMSKMQIKIPLEYSNNNYCFECNNTYKLKMYILEKMGYRGWRLIAMVHALRRTLKVILRKS